MKAVIIINPNSGKRNKKIDTKRIESIFKEFQYEVTILFTHYQNHAKEIVQSLDFVDLVVSVGGDGTFNEIMSGNFCRKERLLLAHIPSGTANDLGAMYGYGRPFYKNLRLLLNGTIKKIDICTINDQPFTYVAALGKFTNVSYDTPRWMKKKFGYLAYLIEGIKELKIIPKLYSIEYEVNGKNYQGDYSFLLISNANQIGGIRNFYSDIKLDDNCFEVLFCSMTHYKDVVKSLCQLTKTDFSNIPGFQFYKTNHLKLTFQNYLKKGFSIDGEELKEKNKVFDIKIVNNVEILIPNKNISKLFLEKE